jgi:RNA polymerase sigma-70 factor (ECF subfamily)
MSATAPLLFGIDETLRRAAAGDHDAFADLIREHEAMVFSIALHFFHDRSRAEEITQEVFLKMYRNLGEIESAAHLTFWLRRVTANRCIDDVRSNRPLGRAESPSYVSVCVESDPFLSRRLRALLQQLPPKQRMAITMRYQEDLEPAEIAEILGMPANTVKSHLRRGLAALRQWLGRDFA